MGDATRLIEQIEQGDKEARGALFALFQDELKKIAAAKMQREKPGHVLQVTALVNELWAQRKLFDTGRPLPYKNSREFLGIAGRAMQQVLVDIARRKRPPDPLLFDPIDGKKSLTCSELLDVHDALDKLEQEWPDLHEILVLRIYLGFTVKDTAEALELSEDQVKKLKARALARLGKALGKKA